GVRLAFTAERLPLLPGVRRLAAEGHLTGGCRRNRDWLADKVRVAPGLPADLVEVAFDPQTSGGLLVALSETDAGRAVGALAARGVAAVVVGTVEASAGGPWVDLR
ncbi:MAG: selenide, water dikinase SelD, partial [Deltaproteobacteria bacterium]